jgi:hypothetical protein
MVARIVVANAEGELLTLQKEQLRLLGVLIGRKIVPQ